MVLDCRLSHAEGDVAKWCLGGVAEVLHAQNTNGYAQTQEGVRNNPHGRRGGPCVFLCMVDKVSDQLAVLGCDKSVNKSTITL